MTEARPPSPAARARRNRRARFHAASADRSELLSFMLATEEYAVDLLRIREIIRWRQPTEVPRAPAFVEGIISLRGEIVPVLDVRKRLRLRASPPGKQTRILIVTRGGDPYGIIVDDVRHVVRVLPEEVEPTPPIFSGPEVEFLAGIWRPGARRGVEQDPADLAQMVILLSLDRVLAFEIAKGRP
jgi:purine-binding chemotaxis protein CheW